MYTNVASVHVTVIRAHVCARACARACVYVFVCVCVRKSFFIPFFVTDEQPMNVETLPEKLHKP